MKNYKKMDLLTVDKKWSIEEHTTNKKTLCWYWHLKDIVNYKHS